MKNIYYIPQLHNSFCEEQIQNRHISHLHNLHIHDFKPDAASLNMHIKFERNIFSDDLSLFLTLSSHET